MERRNVLAQREIKNCKIITVDNSSLSALQNLVKRYITIPVKFGDLTQTSYNKPKEFIEDLMNAHALNSMYFLRNPRVEGNALYANIRVPKGYEEMLDMLENITFKTYNISDSVSDEVLYILAIRAILKNDIQN